MAGCDVAQSRVRRSSIISASVCCKADPSSNLGSAPQGGPFALSDGDEDIEEWASANVESVWIVWMCIVINKQINPKRVAFEFSGKEVFTVNRTHIAVILAQICRVPVHFYPVKISFLPQSITEKLLRGLGMLVPNNFAKPDPANLYDCGSRGTKPSNKKTASRKSIKRNRRMRINSLILMLAKALFEKNKRVITKKEEKTARFPFALDARKYILYSR